MSAQAQEESTGLVDGPTTIHDDDHERMERTPLPKMQLLTVFLIMAAEPVTATVIYPFINQFIRDTGINKGNETKTGYYAGIIVRWRDGTLEGRGHSQSLISIRNQCSSWQNV